MEQEIFGKLYAECLEWWCKGLDGRCIEGTADIHSQTLKTQRRYVTFSWQASQDLVDATDQCIKLLHRGSIAVHNAMRHTLFQCMQQRLELGA